MEQGNIYKKIPLIMGEVGAIGKDQQVKEGPARFYFRGIDQVYNALNLIMSKHGVFTVSKILSKTINPIVSRSGSSGSHAIVDYEFTFYADDGSFVKSEVVGEAIDYGDKSFNKSIAAAHKYALTQIFVIPYEDMEDPDNTTHDIKPQQQRQRPAKVEKPSFKVDVKGDTYVIPFGNKYKGMTLDQIDKKELKAYYDFFMKSASDEGKELIGPALEFAKKTEEYLGIGG